MRYDNQAPGFDKRVAIPAETVESMAAAVAEIARLQQGDTLLEIGPGTGMLSLPLIGQPIRYIGFDRSPAMLAVFREKVKEAGLRAEPLVADGNDRWPAEDGSVAAVFATRDPSRRYGPCGRRNRACAPPRRGLAHPRRGAPTERFGEAHAPPPDAEAPRRGGLQRQEP